jgi:hypothetical protein
VTIFLQVETENLAMRHASPVGVASALSETLTLSNIIVVAQGVQLKDGLVTVDTPKGDMRWGVLLTENVLIAWRASERMTFSQLSQFLLRMSATDQLGYPVSLSERVTIGVASSQIVAWTIIERFRVSHAAAPTFTFGVALAEALRVNSALASFFGASIDDNLRIGLTQNPTYVANGNISDLLAIHPSFANTMVFNLASSFDLVMDDGEFLSMIYAGDPLMDIVNVSALYVAPNGNYTTWAINTRTNAITEYQNFFFNGFARMGRKYIAANSGGLYELDGPTDLVLDVDGTIQSGFFAPGGSKFTAFNNIYIGMRTNSAGAKDFLLQLIAGDGRTYTYAFQPQPGPDIMTSKINTGKGLRSRYFAFKLIVPGQDFDFDSIEFIPLISKRRV